MSTINLLYKTDYPINDYIRVVIPTVGEILEDEDGYYNAVSMFTSAPIDMMVQLEDAGIDFTKISDFELFLILFPSIQKYNTSLVLGDLDLSNFLFAENPQNGQPLLVDPETGIKIDKAIYNKIAVTLRTIHHIKRDNRKPANKEAREYMIERARIKMKRKNRSSDSELEKLIVDMVNAPEYKYDFEGTKELTIYQFNQSVRQVIHRVDYNNKMRGVYAGTIDPKGLSQSDLNWLEHIN